MNCQDRLQTLLSKSFEALVVHIKDMTDEERADFVGFIEGMGDPEFADFVEEMADEEICCEWLAFHDPGDDGIFDYGEDVCDSCGDEASSLMKTTEGERHV